MIEILAVVWIFLNIIDMVISAIGIGMGATDIGLVYRFIDNFTLASVVKMTVAAIIAGYIVLGRKLKLAIFANCAVLGVLVWNLLIMRQLV